MATINTLNSLSPIEVAAGGTGEATFTAYAIICAGTTAPGDLQSIASVGSSNQVLTSNGAAALPTFQDAVPADIAPTVTTSTPTTGGEIFYDTSSDTWTGYGAVAGTWTAKNSLNTARRVLAGGGTSTDAVSFGGKTTVTVGTTEKWDGTNWSASTGMNTASDNLAGCGTSASDGLAFGGQSDTDQCQRFDGSSWTTKNNMNTGRIQLGGAGNPDDALSFGGNGFATTTERFDGTNWTAKTGMSTGRQLLAGAGANGGDVIAFGGTTGSVSAVTELYNGTGNSWSTVGSMNTARDQLAGCGNADSGLSFGGNAYLATTERYDGIGDAWSAVTSMNTARSILAGAGSNGTSGLSFGGFTGSNSAVTEEYDGIGDVTFTVT